MLKKKIFFIIIPILVISIVTINFLLFPVFKMTQFYIHNSLALLIGLSLTGLSLRLLFKGSFNRPLLLFNIFVGAYMIGSHLVKIIIGNCV